MYNVNHTNVDGYGNVGQESTLAGAYVRAAWLQCCARANNDPWHYTYFVDHPYSRRHCFAPSVDQLPIGLITSERLAWQVDNGLITEAEYNEAWRAFTASVCPIASV